MVVHSVECIELTAKAIALREAYARRYPNYCRRCDGWGLVSDWGSRGEPPGSDLCSACEGKCPRCLYDQLDEDGYDRFVNEELVCPGCGFSWNQESGDGGGAPPGAEACPCWIEKEE